MASARRSASTSTDTPNKGRGRGPSAFKQTGRTLLGEPTVVGYSPTGSRGHVKRRANFNARFESEIDAYNKATRKR